MPESKHVKPNKGFVIIDPLSLRSVPEDGAIVPWNSYWRRRVGEGSLHIVEKAKRLAPKKKQTKTEDTDK